MDGMTLLALYGLAGVATLTLVWSLWSTAAATYADFRAAYIAEAQASLADIFSTMPAERVFEMGITGATAVFLIGFVAINWIAGLLFAVGMFFAPRMFFNVAREQRQKKLNEQLVDGLGLMANSLRAGLTLPQAMELLIREMKPPITQEFGRVLQEYRLGTDFDEAMLHMARRIRSRDLDVLVNAIMVTRRSGGNIGEIFQSIAATIRERFRIEGKIRAMSATGNMQALVMSGMPFGIMAALWVMQPEYVTLMFTTNAGLAALAFVLFLVVLSFFWIRWIMDIDI